MENIITLEWAIVYVCIGIVVAYIVAFTARTDTTLANFLMLAFTCVFVWPAAIIIYAYISCNFTFRIKGRNTRAVEKRNKKAKEMRIHSNSTKG
jgi:purine-cytosine permease-like protein